MPWARWPDNGIENLVASHPGCNNSKRDFFAATRHLEAWLPRFDPASRLGRDLRDAAVVLDWDAHPERTLNVARALYLDLPGTAKLRLSHDAFENADRARIVTLLGQ